MSATKMNAQEIIKFIADAKKKTPVKVTFNGELHGTIPWSVVKLGNVLFGDWEEIKPLLVNLEENKTYVVEQDARNSAVPLLDKRDRPHSPSASLRTPARGCRCPHPRSRVGLSRRVKF